MTDPTSPESWLKSAKSDLILAKIPRPEGVFYEHLCYHAQQAVEKSLKGVLIRVGHKYPPTHNLQVLVDALPSTVYPVPFASEISILTEYATLRYLDEDEPVSSSEYIEAIVAAEEIVKWAEGIILGSP